MNILHINDNQSCMGILSVLPIVNGMLASANVIQAKGISMRLLVDSN